MRLRPEQLAGQPTDVLLPMYLVSGEEPFQLGQVCDAIRQRAHDAGYTNRTVMQVDRSFDWQTLTAAAQTLSLFAEKQLIELRLPSGKPGDAGSKALVAYCDNPPVDTCLLIIAGKLDKPQQTTKWFKALDRIGAVIQVWPVDAAQLPQWIAQRMRVRDMQPTSGAVAMLADRIEGNLLAADQELEKLRLLNGGGAIDVEAVAAAVSDSARYDVFTLVDAALLGNASRTARILYGLRAEGVEPVLVLWALTRELRSLCGMSRALTQDQSVGQVMAQYRVWDKRKPPLQAALTRYPLKRWQGLLWQAGEVERVIKGQAAGRPWDELLQLSFKIAGQPLFRAAAG
jgi:DNA polymerase-3 subunit delta